MSKRAAPGHRSRSLRGSSLQVVPTDSQQLEHVPGLSPEALHHLIQDRGLESSGALVAAATPRQVMSVLDMDLWHANAAGGPDQFDAARFRGWLEALMEEGAEVAARVVAAMDPRLATLGLSRHVQVFDPGVMAATGSREEAAIGGYLVRATTTQAWDAIAGLLVGLAEWHPDAFHALMQGCRRLSDSAPEVDGLDALLPAPEQSLHDASIERDDRRAAQGYLTTADARAFLQMARQRRKSAEAASIRALVAECLGAGGDSSTVAPEASAGVIAVSDAEAAAFERQRELAFLANALVAGCSVYGRPFTADEARDAAVGIFTLGREVAPDRVSVLAAFEAGWLTLHQEVAMFVASSLVEMLQGLHVSDTAIQADLRALRRSLKQNSRAGTPWLASKALDVIAILDLPSWACLCGLLSECPVMPAALPALLDGHAESVSATAFEPVATRHQIRQVHDFITRLPALLTE